MAARSRDSWRGGRRSSRSSEREEAAKPSWKRRSGNRRGTRSGQKPWGRMLLVGILMLALVALGIWMFRPKDALHTHFVVLNLLTSDVGGRASSESFDPSGIPVLPQLEESRRPLAKVTSSRSPSLRFLNEDSEDDLRSARVIAVYLQTQIVTGQDGDCWCLVKNSTPDLEDSAQYEKLNLLKEQLVELAADDKRILLLIDEIGGMTDWRLGDFQADAEAVVTRWPEEEEFKGNLVVAMTGTTQGQPGFAGSELTAFGAATQAGFSAAADTTNQYETAKNLSVLEFCEYLSQTTDEWVRDFRQPRGQSLTIVPSPEDLAADTRRNFVVLGELPQPPPVVTPQRPDVQNDVHQLWIVQDQLDDQLAWRWAPELWQASIERLLRAQHAMLYGSHAVAADLVGQIKQDQKDLSAIVAKHVARPEELNTTLGLPRVWFQDLPLAGETSDLWEQAEPLPSQADASTAAVLQQNLNDYPFTQLSISRPDAADSAITVRQNADRISALSMTVTDLLKKTLQAAEQNALRAEDQLFVRTPPETPGAAFESNRRLWTSILEFAEAHQQAEVTCQKTLAASASLAQWAADFEFAHDESFYDDWGNLLRRNVPSVAPASSTVNDLLAEADRLATQTQPGIGVHAVPLRADIFRLLCATRRLSQLLEPVEPESGYSETQLAKLAQDLVRTRSLCDQAWSSIEQHLQAVGTQLVQRAVTRPEMVLQHARLRSLIGITCLPTGVRKNAVERLVRLDQDLTAITEDEDESQDTNAFASDSEALWFMQHLNLFTDAAGDRESVTAVRRTADAVIAENGLALKPLAEFGAAVRSFWSDVRSEALRAQTSTGEAAIRRLRTADRLVRGFSAFDISRLNGSPTARLHTLLRVDYCLTHADRILAGQWVRPADQQPLASNGWYALIADQWLQEGEDIATGLSRSDAPPPFVQTEVQQRRGLLQEAALWTVQPSSSATGRVSLRNDNQADAEVTLRMNVSREPPAGTAALQLLPVSSSSLVQFPANGQSLMIPLPEASMNVVAHRDGSPGGDGCTALEFRPRVFYRGRTFEAPGMVSVDPCAADQFVVRRTAREPNASVTVSGDDLRPIAFVLDMSASMDEKLQDGQKRVRVALNTLNDIVQGRDERTKASLRVFGHRTSFNRQNPGRVDINRAFEAAFRRRVPEINPQQDVQNEIEITTLNTNGKKTFSEVIEKLRSSGPFGVTPLLRALKEAYQRDLRNKPGILIAVTDGIATDAGLNPRTLEVDPRFNDQSDNLRDAIQENSATKVIIVAFDIQDQKERTALSTIMQRCGISQNQIVNAQNGAELQKRIQEGLDPLEFSVSGRLKSENAALDATIAGIPPAADYQITYAEIAPFSNLPLGPGDRVIMRVDWEDDEFEFDRPSRSNNSVEAERPSESDVPWILREFEAQIVTPTDGRQTGPVSLTLMLDHRNREFPVRQPEEIEFRFTSSRQFRAPEIEEEHFPDLGAPAYRFRIAEWPIDQKLHVDAAWKMDRTSPEVVVAWNELEQRESLGASGDLPDAGVSTTLRDGILEVRLNPRPGTAQADDNAVEDIRIEVGSRGELNRNDSFVPDEVTTAIHRTENGAVIFRFDGNYTRDSLADREIAFTSRRRRLSGAIRPSTMIIDPANVSSASQN